MTETTNDLDAAMFGTRSRAKTSLAPTPIAKASGITLTGEDGTEYLDMISSWWVNLHGHAHPKIAEAVAEQARTLEQVIFADFTHAPAATLAKRITDRLPEDLNRVFFSDDGSTAVEVALKLAHQYWRNQGQIRPRFIAFDGGYHGDTVGAMSAGASSGFFDAFKPMLFRVDSVPYPKPGTATRNSEKETCSRSLGTLLEVRRQRRRASSSNPWCRARAA